MTYVCTINNEGYCTQWYWRSRIKGWDMKPGTSEGKPEYYLNVRKHSLICVSCPSYRPKEV